MDNRITQVDNLEGLKNLENLNLRNNPIRNVKGLKLLENLKVVTISGEKIADIEGLITCKGCKINFEKKIRY